MGEQQHTAFAGQAVGLAELFKYSFSKKKLPGPINYTPELSAPEGPSTAGGKQPLQHVKLVPDSGATLVIGTANMVEKSCELRTFRHMDDVHRQRFKGAPFNTDQAQYTTLIEDMRNFFVSQHYTVSMHDAAAVSRPMPAITSASRPVAVPAVAKLPSKTSVGLIVAITTTVALLATVAAILLRR